MASSNGPDTTGPDTTPRIVALGLTAGVLVSLFAGGLVVGAPGLAPSAADADAAAGQDRSSAAADAGAAATQGPAFVRFLHASPDTLPVNVSVDDQQLVTNASFGNVSDYFRVAAGTHTVTVTLARNGTDDVVLQETVNVSGDTRYTVAVAGESTTTGEGGVEPVVLVDNATEPSGNQTSVRLTHLSPDAPAVDVTLQDGEVVLFDDVSPGNSSRYATVPAGNYTLEIRAATANDSGPVVATVDVSLSEGTAYEAYATGYLDSEQAIRDVPLRVVLATPTVAEPSPDTMVTPTPEEPGNATTG